MWMTGMVRCIQTEGIKEVETTKGCETVNVAVVIRVQVHVV